MTTESAAVGWSSADVEVVGADLCPRSFVASRPQWAGGAISAHDVRFLAGLVHLVGARHVTEIGVASGWSSAVTLKALAARKDDFRLSGIDLSETFYLDGSIPTGRVVDDLLPELLPHYRLLTGRPAYEAISDVGRCDFAFIDGHHMHPWATIDMISVLSVLRRGDWVAMHDLNLCTYERHKHRNRGSYYLFYLWPDTKLHSTQVPTMIGAVRLDREPEEYLSILLEVLCTPWEISLSESETDSFLGFVNKTFGSSWREKYSEVMAIARP
ncbi:class I SAM-dependent methyltransferase [Sphingomonas fennica]|uniref:class I SAM-dependent methyltransferase n=1 Tax=Edaphosphingomonas fennica TaxID=114404 RepID=UPI0014747897|nr:class I SAM-dependent methyltransferase [Sphingomonas fennica]